MKEKSCGHRRKIKSKLSKTKLQFQIFIKLDSLMSLGLSLTEYWNLFPKKVLDSIQFIGDKATYMARSNDYDVAIDFVTIKI